MAFWNADEANFEDATGLEWWQVPQVPYHRGFTGGTYARDTRDRLTMMGNLRANDAAHGNTAHYPMRNKLRHNARKYDYQLALMERRHDHPYLGERLYARGLAEKYAKPPVKPSRPVMFYTYGKHFHKYHKGFKQRKSKYQVPGKTPKAFYKKSRFADFIM